MDIAIIVAASQNGVIGRQGGLPWRLPADLARFKHLTMGYPVIMGRKTYESIGRPLQGRQNIIISRNQSYSQPGIKTVNSFDAALAAAESNKVFVIGGESIFKEALTVAGKVYLTRVKAKVEGDKLFDFSGKGWRQVSAEAHRADEKNQFPFEFQDWVRA